MDLPINYCARCIMPETQEGQSFDEFGYCNVCRSQEEKMRIDWVSRKLALSEILENFRELHKDDEYDCLIPISGGKDSTFQLHVLVNEFKMRPLAVTFSHNWFSPVGFYNLMNALEVFDVDHLMLTPKRSTVNKSAKRSLTAIGDACWHCHAGIGSFPLRTAAQYGIRLVIWGESAVETSSRGTYANPVVKFDQDYFTKVSSKVAVKDFVTEEFDVREMRKFENLSLSTYEEHEIFGIHLGDYIYWDEERQTEFVMAEYGWKRDSIEGTYKGYKSTECVMAGVHDFACYLKRGFGRTSFHVSSDIRSGILSRDQVTSDLIGLERTEPATLEYFTEITGINFEEFQATLQKHQHASLKGIPLPVVRKQDGSKRKKLFVEFLREQIEQESSNGDIY
jgi:N-acetyl sugar amidotransferase